MESYYAELFLSGFVAGLIFEKLVEGLVKWNTKRKKRREALDRQLGIK